MKNYKTTKGAICPICGKIYFDEPALSRADSETLICAECGIRQALDSIGVSESEADSIVGTIRRHSNI